MKTEAETARAAADVAGAKADKAEDKAEVKAAAKAEAAKVKPAAVKLKRGVLTLADGKRINLAHTSAYEPGGDEGVIFHGATGNQVGIWQAPKVIGPKGEHDPNVSKLSPEDAGKCRALSMEERTALRDDLLEQLDGGALNV